MAWDLAVGNRLRHRVDVQRRSTATDEHGQQLKVWDSVCYVPAAVEPLTGKELDEAQASNYELTHKVTMRYYPGLDIKMRVMFGSRVFAIHSIQNIEERNRVLVMLCKEGMTDG